MKLPTLRRPRPATAPTGAQLLTAGAVEVGPRFVRVGDGYAATLVVTG